MSVKLDTCYRSCNTAYYATGQWREDMACYKSKFALVDPKESTEELIFNGIVNVTIDDEGIFFRADPSKGPDSLSNPSSIRNYYWLQAPVPSCVREKFLSITNNSGKFLVFVELDKIDDLWEQFKKVYTEGNLGYGLQSSTVKFNSHGRGRENGVITIHTNDAFDLDEVARIAWQIDRTLGNWKGVLQYMTDRTTKSFYGSKDKGENQMLYSISSWSFINDAKNGGTDKKSLSHFLSTFRMRFTEKARARQQVLTYKNWQKFI